ncbi:hypothetical protein ACHWQZ_G005728 [Mnemiopsis leidyi]
MVRGLPNQYTNQFAYRVGLLGYRILPFIFMINCAFKRKDLYYPSISAKVVQKTTEETSYTASQLSPYHTTRTKIATVESMYKTAEVVSSDYNNQRHSSKMVDTLLLNNGYPNRVIEAIKDKRKRQRKRHKTQTSDNTAILKLPYINEATSRKFRDAVKHSELTVKIVEKPGRRLKDLLTDSRPLDKAKCTNKNCRTCESLSPSLDNGDCMSRNTIYKITCTLDNCMETYGGKTYRPLYHRFDEHYRSAANPTAKSFVDKPLAKHYRDKHPKHNGNPQLKLLSL